ncbi:MAG TPA: complement resistance protein TraT [Nitrospira sp.]|nr:complement resistance protein TraT [Nitrospira sp.]
MQRIVPLLLSSSLFAGCASNVVDTDLLVSNTFFLPPTVANTVFIQSRNASDNQQVTLSDLEQRLIGKGYQVVKDHQTAQYLVFTNIVYCNQTKPDLPVEVIVSSGYGSGIGGSIMSGLGSLAGMAGSVAALHPAGAAGGAIAKGATSMLSQGTSSLFGRGGGMGGGPSVEFKHPEGLVYACVADVQIIDRSRTGDLPTMTAAPGTPPPPGIYQTRIGASVYQRKVDMEEATPMVHQRLSAAVAGYF